MTEGRLQPEGRMAPALLQDLAARLSEEDWALLHEWQTELYETVMKELHQALTSLGPVIASSIFSLRPKDKQDIFCPDRRDSESRSSCVPSPTGDKTTSHDGNSGQQLEEVQHSTEPENPQSPCSEHQPLPTEEEDPTEAHSECIQLRHPSSLLQFRIEDGVLAKLLIVQPSEESRNIRRTAGGPVACAEENTACKGLPRKVKPTECRNAVKETLCQQLVQCNQERSSQCEGGAMTAEPSKGCTRTSSIQTSGERKVRNRNLTCVQPSVRPHACTVCQKQFARGYHLRRHQRVHTGERPYHCTECEKSFAQKHYLTAHRASHGGAKPFHCTQCGKTFSSKNNLRKHHIWQHGKKNSSRGHCPYVRAKL